MSNQKHHPVDHHTRHDDDIPRFEPWLGVMASSVVPVMIALYVHSRLFMPLVVAAVVLFLVSVVMLRRQTVRRRRDRQKHRLPDATSLARSFDDQSLQMEGAEP